MNREHVTNTDASDQRTLDELRMFGETSAVRLQYNVRLACNGRLKSVTWTLSLLHLSFGSVGPQTKIWIIQ